ncbi:MAG: FAD:protein FMN transferase [Christensenellales bacterium]|jgi:thiamine biosynthesis lipoprotein
MKRLLLLPILLIALLFSSCAAGEVGDTRFMLDTWVSIKIYGTSDERLLDEAFQLCRDYENKLSRTIAVSEISRLNKEGSLELSYDTAELIAAAIEYSDISGGAFDISIAPVSTLWEFGESERMPTKDELLAALPFVGYKGISIDGNTVTLGEGMSVELGGIAKGYIADRISDFLKENGVKNALIDLGGNIYAVGSRPSGGEWRIAIRQPFKNRDEGMGVLRVRDKSIVTSGVYERFFERDGELYHHLIDPKTGMPAANGVQSVTVVSDKSVDGDALSTAFFVLGAEKGLALAESIEGVEALFILDDGSIVKSSGIGTEIPFELM